MATTVPHEMVTTGVELIGCRVGATEVMGGVTEVLAYGTAVLVERTA